ncbi:MAG: deaminase [Pseudomonadota bacterium]|nr:deaminase [Pseudomonadota bacterium]
MRPSFEEIFLTMAHHLARRSTCKRLQVGTVISSTDHCKIFAIGYNGNAHGLPNGCDRDEAGNCGCLHSEENAAIHCDTPRTTPKYVYVTHLPCPYCAKRLINLGSVRKVHFNTTYRDESSLPLFAQVGIEVIKYEKMLNIY